MRLDDMLQCLAKNDVQVITDLAGLDQADLVEADCFTGHEHVLRRLLQRGTEAWSIGTANDQDAPQPQLKRLRYEFPLVTSQGKAIEKLIHAQDEFDTTG